MVKKISTVIIFTTVFIDLLGFGIIIPILPAFATKKLSMTEFDIGLVIASFSFVQFIVSPILGGISDKIGRRPVILLSLFITASSYVLLSFANSFLILLIARMLAGLGGGNIGVAQAYISDITTIKNRTKGMGMIGAAFGMGFVLGPMLGGLLSKYGYMVVGLSSASLSFIAFLFALFYLPESNPNTDKEVKLKIKIIDFKSLKEIAKQPALSSLILLFFIITFSMANLHGTFALLGLKHYLFSDEQIAYLYAVMGFAIVLVQGGLIRFITDKFKNKTLVFFGLTSWFLGLSMLPYGSNYVSVILITLVMSLGSGVLQPVTLSMISKYASEKKHGAILGLNHSVGSLGRVLGPLWGGFAFKYLGYQFPFLTAALFSFLTLVLTFILYLKNIFIE